MTNFVQDWNLVNGNAVVSTLPGNFDTLLVTTGVTIASTDPVGTAVQGKGQGQSVYVNGTVFADLAIVMEQFGSAITVGETGSVFGEFRALTLAGALHSVTNAGMIGGIVGISAGGLRLVNSGTISTFQSAISCSGTLTITNTGLIASTGTTIVTSATSFDTVTNRGTIVGDIFLGDGNDSAIGGAGVDLVFDGTGADEIDTGAGDDTVFLSADSTPDTVDGGAGSDLLVFSALSGGTSLRVTLAEGTARSSGMGLTLISGFENVRGWVGQDTILGDRADNRIIGDGGADRLEGADGDDRLFGGAGANTLFGGNGNDRLTGGADGETLNGGNGDDLLTGGGSFDILIGGTGADIFLFAALADLATGATGERITDFVAGSDRIDLSGIDWDGTGQDSAYVFVGAGPVTAAGQVAVRQTASATIIDLIGPGLAVAGSIRLDGLVTLAASDFFL